MGVFLEISIFIIIIVIASILQTSTGFGFSILATPFLLLIFQPEEAIQINLLLSFIISCTLIISIRKDIDFNVLKRLVISSLIGLPFGMILFLLLDISKLKLVISLIIIILTIMLIFKFRISQTRGRDFIVGGFSGLLTTSIGMPGPPLLLYFTGTNAQKETIRATTLAFYLFIYFISLIIQVSFAGTTKTVWVSSGIALPLVIVGLYGGQLLFKRISQPLFRKITYIILLFTGIYMFIESFSG